MKQTPKRLLCIALLVAMLITAALPCFAQDGDPTPQGDIKPCHQLRL